MKGVPTVSRVWKTHMDCMENTHYCVIYTNFRGLVYQICVVHTTFNQINLKNIVNHTKCVKSTKRWRFAVAAAVETGIPASQGFSISLSFSIQLQHHQTCILAVKTLHLHVCSYSGLSKGMTGHGRGWLLFTT